MRIAYYSSVAIHILAAVLWLGGMFFLGVVGAPVLRRIDSSDTRQRLFHAMGMRFRAIAWAAIVVLVATGVLNLHLRGLLRWDGVLGSAAFWRSAFGLALAVKLAAVAAMFALSAVHDFVLGPAASRADPVSPGAAAQRRRAAAVARWNSFFGIVVVLAAVLLVRGG